MTDDKKKALEQTILQIEKEFGKGAIMKLGSYAATRNIEVIPTGCLPLDVALGVGGLPKGRIIEIYGPEASGKTTVTLSHRFKKWAEQPRLSTRSKRWTPFMPPIWA